MPKFQDQATWQQAELVMQPALIRVIANVGKQLEQKTDWKGTYEDVEVWEAGVSAAVQGHVRDLRSRLESAPPDIADQIRQDLAQLPAPYPGYQLRLTPGNAGAAADQAVPNESSRESANEPSRDLLVAVELWDLCYQICFRNYDSATGTSWTGGFGKGKSQGVAVDPALFKPNGDVDWVVLDAKAQQVVERIFANLP